MIKFFAAVIIILAAFVTFIYPLANSIKQGLDLQGGTHIVLEAVDTPEAPVTDDSLNRAVSIVERRINEMGLTEPIVQKEGARRIIVELPGEKNPEKAIETIGKTVLEFKDESGTTRMTGNDLKTAKEQIDQGKKNVVAIEFTDEGAKKFADLTASNVGRKIGIYLDGAPLTEPVVNEPITGGKAVITGSKTLEDAKNLAILLRSGALPVKFQVAGPYHRRPARLQREIGKPGYRHRAHHDFPDHHLPDVRCSSQYRFTGLRPHPVVHPEISRCYSDPAGHRRGHPVHGLCRRCEYPYF